MDETGKHSWARALSPEGLSAPDAPRIAIIAAHPDDEAASAGSLIPFLNKGWLVHVTDGAPRDLVDAFANGILTRSQYATARNREARAALEVARFPEDRLISMGLVDQEASLDLAGLARAICALIVRLGPDAVLTHPYEGSHPDHDATAFAVHAGAALLARSPRHHDHSVPELLEMAGHHAGAVGEPLRARFLVPDGDPIVRTLGEKELTLKKRMIECFRTQRRMLHTFDLGVERYRAAIRYDFTLPPHSGKLHYEDVPWGMEEGRFIHLTREAMAALELEGTL